MVHVFIYVFYCVYLVGFMDSFVNNIRVLHYYGLYVCCNIHV